MTVLAPGQCTDMGDIRQQIDRLDRELMALFSERARYIDRAADIKIRDGLPAQIQWRVEEVANNARRNAEQCNLDADFAEQLWRQLIDWSIGRENKRLLPTGSSTEQPLG